MTLVTEVNDCSSVGVYELIQQLFESLLRPGSKLAAEDKMNSKGGNSKAPYPQETYPEE